MTIERAVYTIGHSTHTETRLIELLHMHAITAVCDVRSTPYSRVNPQFNREPLECAMQTAGITYRFLGQELGARSQDPACYEDGKVQYARLAQTPLFRYGLQRVLTGLRQGFRIALMCAEKEPLKCHRTILVARHLVALGVPLQHIHADGHLEAHAAALDRLARMLKLPQDDMFQSPEDQVAEAYRQQEQRIGYHSPTQQPSPKQAPSADKTF